MSCTVKLVIKTTWEIWTPWGLRTATSVPRSIQYTEMDLRNKTTSEFRTVFGSPLGVPNSQVALYISVWHGISHSWGIFTLYIKYVCGTIRYFSCWVNATDVLRLPGGVPEWNTRVLYHRPLQPLRTISHEEAEPCGIPATIPATEGEPPHAPADLRKGPRHWAGEWAKLLRLQAAAEPRILHRLPDDGEREQNLYSSDELYGAMLQCMVRLYQFCERCGLLARLTIELSSNSGCRGNKQSRTIFQGN